MTVPESTYDFGGVIADILRVKVVKVLIPKIVNKETLSKFIEYLVDLLYFIDNEIYKTVLDFLKSVLTSDVILEELVKLVTGMIETAVSEEDAIWQDAEGLTSERIFASELAKGIRYAE